MTSLPALQNHQAMNYTFKKEERLCHKTLIAELYHSGSSFLCYPFRVVWMPVTVALPAPAQVLIAVPKKRYKHAVDRNLIKRRIREVYRLQKGQHLYAGLSAAHQQLVFSVNYIGKEITDYQFMHKKMLKLLMQLNDLALK